MLVNRPEICSLIFLLTLALPIAVPDGCCRAAEQCARNAGEIAFAVPPHGTTSKPRPPGTTSATRPPALPKTSPPPSGASSVSDPIGQGMSVFDEIMDWVLKSRGIPGGALAIAKDGKLVVARGYGLANTQTREPVSLNTKFCVASVSKTITAATLLQLVDLGKLALDDPIYPLLGKPRPMGRASIDPQIEKITVRHLLLHAGGWNTKYHPDVLRQTHKISRAAAEKRPLSANTIVRYGFSQPLDFIPGGETHYSNFGYFLAKLVVERAARQPYETYVRQQMLQPMGINEMRLEQLAPAYASHEARRYGPNGRELPGGRDAIAAPAGNWLATVVDLARFLTAVSGTRGKPFLSSAARQQMLALPPPPLSARRSGSHVGLGWDAVLEEPAGVLFYKLGSAAGVRAYIEHRPDGFDWVLLLNSAGQSAEQPPATSEMIDKVRQAIDATRDWPDRDLFGGPTAKNKPKPSVVL
jgi:CubicO group peptidase (beta-lactamase class C family)